MPDFKAKMHQIRFQLAKLQTFLGELTALPRFLAGFKRAYFEGEGGEEKVRERRWYTLGETVEEGRGRERGKWDAGPAGASGPVLAKDGPAPTIGKGPISVALVRPSVCLSTCHVHSE